LNLGYVDVTLAGPADTVASDVAEISKLLRLIPVTRLLLLLGPRQPLPQRTSVGLSQYHQILGHRVELCRQSTFESQHMLHARLIW